MIVDPDDDTIRRFVVWRYRFDSARNQRRNVVEIAFDDEAEFEAYLDDATARLKQEKDVGSAEAQESYGGVRLEAGSRVKAAQDREHERRIIARGRRRKGCT